jgi:hypothetical protein
MLIFFALVMGYEFWKLYRSYDAAMNRHEQRLYGGPKVDE